jgi:hypothetical protein
MSRAMQVYSRRADESGMAMILVIGTALVLMILTTTLIAVTHNSLQSSSQHTRFEQALHTAETGIDVTLARLQKSSAYVAGPNAPASFADAATERTWAKTEITKLAAASSTLLTSTGEGQYLAIRPANLQAVYSMGWTPSFGAFQAKQVGSKQRLLKAEYIFSPDAPAKAILTQGDLTFSGSVSIDSVDTSVTAGVHTNGNVSSSNASLTATGTVTASGSYGINSNANIATGSGGGMPQESVAQYDPATIYAAPGFASLYGGNVDSALGYLGSWYDLCSDGFVYSRPATSDTPCNSGGGAKRLNVLSGNTPFYPYRGWTFAAGAGTSPATWSMSEKSSPYDGVYYVQYADAVIDGKTQHDGAPWHASVIAEAKGSTCASKVGGNIQWKLQDTTNFLQGVVFAAGADLIGSANNDAGSGMFSAMEQIYLSTSSASLTGYLVAADQCPNTANPSKVQGVTIHFDHKAESPVPSLVRTTLWLEYEG